MQTVSRYPSQIKLVSDSQLANATEDALALAAFGRGGHLDESTALLADPDGFLQYPDALYPARVKGDRTHERAHARAVEDRYQSRQLPACVLAVLDDVDHFPRDARGFYATASYRVTHVKAGVIRTVSRKLGSPREVGLKMADWTERGWTIVGLCREVAGAVAVAKPEARTLSPFIASLLEIAK